MRSQMKCVLSIEYGREKIIRIIKDFLGEEYLDSACRDIKI